MNIQDIKLSKYGEIVYNAADAPGCECGTPFTKGSPRPALVYSVVSVHDGIAFCQSRNIFGKIFERYIPLENLEPYSKK